MRFLYKKRRSPPAVIIISLIDILIVLLIFLMVTTTFKQAPAVQLALPESTQAKKGSHEDNLVVTIAKEEPYFYIGTRAVTFARLQTELLERVQANPKLSLSIRADTAAPFGQIVKVMDAAKDANIKVVNAFTKQGGN